MQLDKLNQWLMLAANIGVISGIAFLAVEISQNTEALGARTLRLGSRTAVVEPLRRSDDLA